MEFQLRNDNAMSWYLNWLNYENRIGELFAGVLLDFLRYVEIPKDVDALDIKNNRNQARMKTARWWDKYLQTTNRIRQLYLPGEEYDFSRLQRAAKQTHSTVKTLMLLNGEDWPEYINELNRTKLNRHQRELVTRAGIDPDEELTTLSIGAYTDEVDLPQDNLQTKWIRELLRKDRE